MKFYSRLKKNLISSEVISNVPFNIGFTSFCKSEEADVSNELLTKHFIDFACSSCIEVDVAAIVLKISLHMLLCKSVNDKCTL